MNIAENLVAAAHEHPDRVAVKLDAYTLTYPQLLAHAAGVAATLREQGVAPGDRICLVAPNVPVYPAYFYGALMAGAIVVPMNPLFKGREVEYYLTDSGATRIVVVDAVADEVVAAAATLSVPCDVVGPLPTATSDDVGVEPRQGHDTAVVLYTSGTTGSPKGAELTHANLRTNAEMTAQTLIHSTPDDVIMGCLPLFHVFGLTCALNTSVVTGSCLTLIPRFDPVKALEVIERDKVTVFEGVPTMYGALLHAPGAAERDVSSLRTCVSGGSALPVELMRAFEEQFGCVILEGYGLSETSPVASFNREDAGRKPGSIGTPVRGVEMRLVDNEGVDTPPGEIGEIAIRGENIMKGYWQRPDATAAAIPDGWFRSGDLATRDDDGFYFIVDRKKDLIIRGGYNVYPREVEEVLFEHPAVAEAAVFGVADEHWGEEVAAAVAFKPGASATEAELRAFVKERIADYKYPREVWIMDTLPKGPTGKILRRELRRS